LVVWAELVHGRCGRRQVHADPLAAERFALSAILSVFPTPAVEVFDDERTVEA